MHFSDGLARVGKDERSGYIDKTGKEVIPSVYDHAYRFSEEQLAPVKMNGKWGFINKEGQVTIPFQYDSADSFRDGVVPVEKDGEDFQIDKYGQPVEY